MEISKTNSKKENINCENMTNSHSCEDSKTCTDSSFLYRAVSCVNSKNGRWSRYCTDCVDFVNARDCENCRNITYCQNCENSTNLIYCENQKDKKNYINNISCSPAMFFFYCEMREKRGWENFVLDSLFNLNPDFKNLKDEEWTEIQDFFINAIEKKNASREDKQQHLKKNSKFAKKFLAWAEKTAKENNIKFMEIDKKKNCFRKYGPNGSTFVPSKICLVWGKNNDWIKLSLAQAKLYFAKKGFKYCS